MWFILHAFTNLILCFGRFDHTAWLQAVSVYDPTRGWNRLNHHDRLVSTQNLYHKMSWLIAKSETMAFIIQFWNIWVSYAYETSHMPRIPIFFPTSDGVSPGKATWFSTLPGCSHVSERLKAEAVGSLSTEQEEIATRPGWGGWKWGKLVI